MLEAVGRYLMKYVRYDWQTNSMARCHMSRHVLRPRITRGARSGMKLNVDYEIKISEKNITSTFYFKLINTSISVN